MRALFLPSVLRAAGLDVELVPGWEGRGVELESIDAVLWHHDASPGPRDMPYLSALINGRQSPTVVPGPLAQLGLGRSGRWYVIAAGKANHAGAGAWRGVNRSGRTIGIEAANNGVGEAWPAKQVESYVRGTAAILKHLKLSAGAVCGHKEWALPAGRKPDPRYLDMNQMRARIQAQLSPPVPVRKVQPMWDPPPKIAAGCLAPGGGAWLVTPEGAIYTIAPAPFLGGAFERPYFEGREAAKVTPTDVGYQITATSGETYHFPEGS